MPFNGLRVLSLESRRAAEMETWIRKQGGEPFVAPSMREVPLERNEDVFRFADRLLQGEFDCVILMTGAVPGYCGRRFSPRFPEEESRIALRKLTIVVRGPKPSAAIREIGIVPAVYVAEPNTWHELLAAMRGRAEKRVALQEYGKSNTELIEALRADGRDVTPIRIYGWDLPEDTTLLRQAAAEVDSGRVRCGAVHDVDPNRQPHEDRRGRGDRQQNRCVKRCNRR